MLFQTSLLREKFTIRPAEADEAPVIALSNRIVLTFNPKSGERPLIIRTQNMHSCARFAALILKHYHENSFRPSDYDADDWRRAWKKIVQGHEAKWNPDLWCAVYQEGGLIFQDNAHHPFLDIIEQCDASNKNAYAQAVRMAEDIFMQAGRTVSIAHDSNTALIVTVKDEEAKAGIIVRSAGNTTTFNMTVTAREEDGDTPKPSTILSIGANYLELIQLIFQGAFDAQRKEIGLIKKHTNEDRKLAHGSIRAGKIARAIQLLEDQYKVNYRPDKPDMGKLNENANAHSLKILRPEIERRIKDGTLNQKDWVF